MKHFPSCFFSFLLAQAAPEHERSNRQRFTRSQKTIDRVVSKASETSSEAPLCAHAASAQSLFCAFSCSRLLKVKQLWTPRFPVWRPNSKIEDFGHGEQDEGFRMSHSTPRGAQPNLRSIRGQVWSHHFSPKSVILGEGLSPLPDRNHKIDQLNLSQDSKTVAVSPFFR